MLTLGHRDYLKAPPRASGSSIWAIHQMTGKQKSRLSQERPELVGRKAGVGMSMQGRLAEGGVCGVGEGEGEAR